MLSFQDRAINYYRCYIHSLVSSVTFPYCPSTKEYEAGGPFKFSLVLLKFSIIKSEELLQIQ